MPRRALLVGLDAADLDVLRPLLARGDMPHLAELRAQGASGVLHSTVPPVSAPAWASFLTGCHPGRHGLYSFVVEREGGATQLATLADVRAPKLWDYVAAQGARSLVVNVPVTWPPPPVAGALVTGMLTPESRAVAWTHPPELQAEIERVVPGYRIDVDRAMLDDKETLFGQLSEMTRRRAALFVHLLRTQDWRVAVTVFTNTDRVQHAFWRSRRDLVDAHFREVDAHIGTLLAAIDRSETVVLLMSDHGFQSAHWKLYMNRALEEAGLLATRRGGDPSSYDRRRPDWFADFQGGRGDAAPKQGALERVFSSVGLGGPHVMDWARTQAFTWSLDTGGVAVNLRSRYPHGSVDDADYERVRDAVIAALRALELPEGRPAFRTVRRREEVYAGPFADRAPDVVTEADDALDLGIQLDAKQPFRRHKQPEGHHSPRGFVCVTGPGCRAGATIEGSIVDCLPTLLHAAELGVPPGLDGRVLTGAFADGRAVRAADALALESGAAEGFSAEEEEALRRSLEGLGYL